MRRRFESARCGGTRRSIDVKSLMAGASLFIGNDSGPAHIAAAFGVPVVVIFGSSDPVTWASVAHGIASVAIAGGHRKHFDSTMSSRRSNR